MRILAFKFLFPLIVLLGIGFCVWPIHDTFVTRLVLNEALAQLSARNSQPIKIEACPRCNVVLVVLDTLRADFLGRRVGGTSLTPNLDAISDQGLVFTQAFTNAYFTAPSHLTLMSSIYPHSHQVSHQRPETSRSSHVKFSIDERFFTLAQHLKKSGYSTRASAPKNLSYLEERLGLYRGFDLVIEPIFKRSVLRTHASDGFNIDGWRQLAGRPSEPFFLFVHSYLAHMPYIADELQHLSQVPLSRERLLKSYQGHSINRFQQRHGKGPDALAHAIGDFQQFLFKRHGDNNYLEAAYSSNVRDLDTQIGKFWAESQKLNNTIFIFVSDHGEQFFEHGKVGHSTFHEHTVHIPWFMVGPGIAPQHSDKIVSLVDVMPTILDLLDIEPPAHLQGRSVFSGPGPHRNSEEIVFGHTLGQDFVRGPRWKMFTNKHARPELYYLPLDPGEKNNLANSSNWLVQRAKRELEEKIERWKLSTALQQ